MMLVLFHARRLGPVTKDATKAGRAFIFRTLLAGHVVYPALRRTASRHDRKGEKRFNAKLQPTIELDMLGARCCDL